MQEEKIIILRRLKTKDGLTSEIEELSEYRPREYRALYSRLKTSVREELTLDSGHELPTMKREYVEKRRVKAILVEMEEV